MDFKTATIIITVLIPVIVFWDDIAAWIHGMSYREYLEKQIEELEREIATLKQRRIATWEHWLGLGCALAGVVILDAHSQWYWALLALAVVGLCANVWRLWKTKT